MVSSFCQPSSGSRHERVPEELGPSGHFGLCQFAKHSTGPFGEGEIVCQTSLQQHPDAVIAGEICRGHQCHPLTGSPLSKMDSFCQNEDLLNKRGTQRCKFFAKVFDKDLLNFAGKLYRFLSDEPENLIDLFKLGPSGESTRIESFLDLVILGDLSQFFVDLV